MVAGLGRHGLMLAIMVATMRPGAATLDQVGGALLLAGVSMAVACRRHHDDARFLLDSWAMIALLVLPFLGGEGHHGGSGVDDTWLAALLVLAAWTAGRTRLADRAHQAAFALRAPELDFAVSAAGLVVMAVAHG